MKNTLLFLLLFVLGLSVNAQDNTHVTLHAGETPIEQLLTDEQKQTVTHISITGKLLDEDYAYLRSTLHEQLTELNLRDADIDTIPAHALKNVVRHRKVHSWSLICPARLKHIDENGLYMKYDDFTCVISSRFPTLADGVINRKTSRITCSKDNPLCQVIEDEVTMGELIYSQDLDTLYYAAGMSRHSLKGGTKIIAGHAYEGCSIVGPVTLIIPASVDSIGDKAFYALNSDFLTTGSSHEIAILNYAIVPQKLGKDVFSKFDMDEFHLGQICSLYVPDESLETYKTVEGWKGFYKIAPLSSFVDRGDGIGETYHDDKVNVRRENNTYVITSEKTIRHVVYYNSLGQILQEKSVNNKRCVLESNLLHGTIVSIIVFYQDGDYNIIKLYHQ